MNTSIIKRFSTLCLVLFCLSITPALAKDTTDYDALAKTGTVEEIKSALKAKSGLKTQVFGTNRETMLMLALKYDRDLEVINTLLKSDLKPDATAKDKRTPLMYAAQYSSYPEVVDAIATYGATFASSKRKRAQAKDASGKTAFDYARLNTSCDAYSVLLKYATDPNPNATPPETPSATDRTNSVTFTYGSQESAQTTGSTNASNAATAAPQQTTSAPAEQSTPASSKTTATAPAATVNQPADSSSRSNSVTFTYSAPAPAQEEPAQETPAAEPAVTQAPVPQTSAPQTQAVQSPAVKAPAPQISSNTQTADSSSRTNSVTFTYSAPQTAQTPEPVQEAPAAIEAETVPAVTVTATPAPVQVQQAAPAPQPVQEEQQPAAKTAPAQNPPAPAREEAAAPAPAVTEPAPQIQEAPAKTAESPAPVQSAPKTEPVAITQTVAPVVVESITPVVPSAAQQETPKAQDISNLTQLLPPAEQQAPAQTAPVQTEIRSYTQTNLFDYALMDNQVPQEEETVKAVILENPDLADENGVTLLMKAAKAGNDWDVKKLIDAGASVQLRDKDGWTALMYAVRYQNSASIVKMLIDAGAYVRVRNIYNATPLLLAAEYSQNPEIISILLQNRSAAENEVYNAFILALTSNTGAAHVQIAKIQLFLNLDIALNRIWKGKTPLMYASQYCTSTEVIQLLLDNEARTTIQDSNGKTAFDYAKQNTHLEHNETYWTLNSGM